jgi:dTDP-glucose 4,6-dehydratase/UDP-glucose 4-epimerase
MKRRFLVTGGAGFLGAALVKRLLRDGHFVRVLDDISRGATRRLANVMSDLEFVRGDVRDPAVVDKAVQRVDCVLHLAAVNGTEHFYTKPHVVLEVGLQGMLNVINACQKNGVGDLVVASSSEVYQLPPKIPTDETAPLMIPDPLNPRYSYAGSKIASELIAVAYGRNGFERVAIFRPHNVYGPDMAWEHVVPQFCLRAIDQIAQHPTGPVPFPIQGDGTQTRAFIHIDDMTDGLMAVIEKGKHLNIYHIGNPEELEIANVARQVVKAMGREAHLVSIALPQGSVERRCPDITKLRGLGFEPRIPFRVGLPPAVDWYVKNQHLRPVAA